MSAYTDWCPELWLVNHGNNQMRNNFENVPSFCPGVYFVYSLYNHHNELVYIGSTGDLKQRLQSKHLCGDWSHAIQRALRWAFKENRQAIRRFIIGEISWDVLYATAVKGDATRCERELIARFKPRWNLTGIRGKSISSPDIYETIDPLLIAKYSS